LRESNGTNADPIMMSADLESGVGKPVGLIEKVKLRSTPHKVTPGDVDSSLIKKSSQKKSINTSHQFEYEKSPRVIIDPEVGRPSS